MFSEVFPREHSAIFMLKMNRGGVLLCTNALCFCNRWCLLDKLKMITRFTRVSVGCIILSAFSSFVNLKPGKAGSSWNRPTTEELIKTHMHVRGATTVFRATWIAAITFFFQYFPHIRWLRSVDILRVCISTEDGEDGSKFYNFWNITRMYLSTNQAWKTLWPAQPETIWIQTWKLKLAIFINKSIVSLSKVSSFETVRKREIYWVLIFISHCFKKYFWTSLNPVCLSTRYVCGCVNAGCRNITISLS